MSLRLFDLMHPHAPLTSLTHTPLTHTPPCPHRNQAKGVELVEVGDAGI